MSEFYPFAHIINFIAVDIKGLTVIVDWCELTWVFLMQFSDVCTLVLFVVNDTVIAVADLVSIDYIFFFFILYRM